MTIDNPYQTPTAEMTSQAGTKPGCRKNWREYASEYNAAFKTALMIHGLLAVLTALVLDFGQMHRAFWGAFLCQWAMVWIILFRRPIQPTRLDLAIVRYGIVPILILIVCVVPWMLRMLGVQT